MRTMNTQLPRIAKTFFVVGLLIQCFPVVAGQPAALERVVALLESGREPVRIVCFGDSITGVYYHTGGRRAWCDMLGIALGRAFPRAQLEMFNAGISGNTSAAGLHRIEKDVLGHRPHLVVVMFGMNDVARAPRETSEANLKSIVQRCRDAGAAVVLCTPNSVYENPDRPIARLATYAQTVRQVAAELSVPLADCYRAYEDVRAGNPLAWKLLMSETIHPSMNGHRLFAEVMAQTIAGRPVSLADAAPPEDALRFTLERLRAGEPLEVIAMPPYDRIVPDALRELFPAAKLAVVTWPTEGQSLGQLEQWAKTIRPKNPHLVVVAVPAAAGVDDEETFVRSYSWVLNWSIGFGHQTWDRIVILPSVTGSLTSDQKRSESLAAEIIRGADAASVQRPAGDKRSAAAIVRDYLRRQLALIP
jgi:acyl-CoA thioesterase-1